MARRMSRAEADAAVRELRGLIDAAKARGCAYTLCARCTALEAAGRPAVTMCKAAAARAEPPPGAARRPWALADTRPVLCFVSQALRDDDPKTDAAALRRLDAAIARLQGRAEARKCTACGRYEATGPAAPLQIQVRRCAGCRATRYCSDECQRAHWPAHKAACRAARDAER